MNQKTIKIPLLKKIMLSLMVLPISIFILLKLFIPSRLPDFFSEDKYGNYIIVFCLISYIIVCIILSKRGKKYFFTSNQQFLHNYLLFCTYYPLIYIWILDDKLIKQKFT